jgi:hypothetical protein
VNVNITQDKEFEHEEEYVDPDQMEKEQEKSLNKKLENSFKQHSSDADLAQAEEVLHSYSWVD